MFPSFHAMGWGDRIGQSWICRAVDQFDHFSSDSQTLGSDEAPVRHRVRQEEGQPPPGQHATFTERY